MADHTRPWRNGCYVILHIRPGPPYPDPIATPQIAADLPFELSNDIWIEKLDTDLAIQISELANLRITIFIMMCGTVIFMHFCEKFQKKSRHGFPVQSQEMMG